MATKLDAQSAVGCVLARTRFCGKKPRVRASTHPTTDFAFSPFRVFVILLPPGTVLGFNGA